MSRNYADERSVIDAIREVMKTRQRIDSQKELATLVLEALRKTDPEARVSAGRIRRIAVTSGVVKLEIEYRESDRRALPDICPVCGNGMTSIINNTLDGEKVEIKRNCTVCPYTMGRNVSVPGRYVFVRTREVGVTSNEERIRKLKKAASMLRGASRLISEAVEGTNFPQRSEYAREMIEEILHSREMTGSIPNLEADIRGEGHNDPLWTQSLSSPKYPNRKHI